MELPWLEMRTSSLRSCELWVSLPRSLCCPFSPWCELCTVGVQAQELLPSITFQLWERTLSPLSPILEDTVLSLLESACLRFQGKEQMEAALAILSMEVGGISRSSGLPWLPDRERWCCLPSPAGLSVLTQCWAGAALPDPILLGSRSSQQQPRVCLKLLSLPALSWLPFLKAEPCLGFLVGARGCGAVSGSASSGFLPFLKGRGTWKPQMSCLLHCPKPAAATEQG